MNHVHISTNKKASIFLTNWKLVVYFHCQPIKWFIILISETARYLPLCIQGRLKHGFHFTLKSILKGKKNDPESELNEFEPRLKSAKNPYQLITGLIIETLNTIVRGTNL